MEVTRHKIKKDSFIVPPIQVFIFSLRWIEPVDSLSIQTIEMTSPFRNDCLAGKVALVTGGGSGICFELTKQLLVHGAKAAVICGRRQKFLERSASILQRETGKICKWKVCDVRDPKACEDAVQYTVEQFSRLDILVNGAAGNFLAEARALKPKGFATVMSIDALGTFNMSSAAFPALAKTAKHDTTTQDAIVINISGK